MLRNCLPSVGSTSPTRAFAAGCSNSDQQGGPHRRDTEMLANTAQFDCTHHPAMSLPCGMVDGLPVGMMLVAKDFDEETIYRAAAALERGVDWKTLVAL